MTEQRRPDLRTELTSLVSTILMNPDNAIESFAGWCKEQEGRSEPASAPTEIRTPDNLGSTYPQH